MFPILRYIFDKKIFEVQAFFAQMRHRTLPALGVLLIVPGLAGVLGGGAIDPHTALGADISASYAPDTYLHQPTTWELSVVGLMGSGGKFTIRLDKNDFKHFSIQAMSPMPTSIVEEDEDMAYTFDAALGHTIDITLLPISVGKTAVTVQYGMDPPVPFPVTTLP